MECSVKSLSEDYSKKKQECIDYYGLISILEVDKSIETVVENIKIIEHIEKVIQSYIEYLENKTIFSYISNHTKWFDLEEIENIKNLFRKFIRQIYLTTIKNDISIRFDNSIIDILGNGPHNYMQYISKQIDKKRKYSSYLDNIVETIKKLQRVIVFYLETLCLNENKLYIALTNNHDYIEKYSGYFQKMNLENGSTYTMYPSGSEKLYYFQFFLSCETGDISSNDLEEKLEDLEGNILNKEKIRKDFPNFECS